MLLSYNWLKKYIDIPEDITPDILARELSRHVAEVEGHNVLGAIYNNIVVGKIAKLSKHTHADKLSLCQVEIGDKKKVQVVCGGTNLEKGMMIAIALPGAKVRWHGKGDLIEMKKAVIRGEESTGMICASDEIGLGQQYKAEDGAILDLALLKTEIKVGDSLAAVLGQDDIVFEVDNKTLSNRPDLFCHYGFAREISAIFNLPLRPEGVQEFALTKGSVKITIEDYKDCTRWMGVKIEGIKIGPSPSWLIQQLEAVGLRSINNIVDITNYVMFDLGQPMHAFDYDKLNGGELNVRRAKIGESIDLLDGTSLDLNEELLIIADSKNPVALAGVMGGANSEVTDCTTTILLECANFHPRLVRSMSTAVGLRSDSSVRFEKSLDPHLPVLALKRAVNMIQQAIPNAKVVSKLIDEHNDLPCRLKIEFKADKVRELLGSSLITNEFIEQGLTSLGFKLNKIEDGHYDAMVPTWRSTKDITQFEDIVEEVVRLYGYDKIPAQAPHAITDVPPRDDFHKLEREVKYFCSYGLGMNEVFNYSFVAPETLDLMGITYDDYLRLENPIAQDIPLIRQSLIPNLLESVKKNIKYDNTLAIYELARVFLPTVGKFNVDLESDEKLALQPYHLTGCFVSPEDQEPFYKAKNAVSSLLDMLNISYIIKKVEQDQVVGWMHPLRTVEIWSLHDRLGFISEIHPAVSKKFNVKNRIGIFDLDFGRIVDLATVTKKYKAISKYPSITLDVSMTVDEKLEWAMIKNIVLDVEKQLVKDIELFDVFINDELKEAGKKSLALRIKYQSDDSTLEQSDVQKIHDKILSRFEKDLQAQVRK